MKGETATRCSGSEESATKENKEAKQVVESSASSAPASAAAPPVSAAAAATVASGGNANARARQPFTQLSQIESDLVLARTLQEQERAYVLLRNGGGQHYHQAGYDDESEDDDEGDDRLQAPGANAGGAATAAATIDGSQYESDEAFARALQENEEREHAARMMALAGIHDLEEDADEEEEDEEEGGEENEEEDGEDEIDEDLDDDDEDEDEADEDEEDEEEDDDSQEWQDVDPDHMSYEELVALGDAVGVESRGLSAAAIAELPVTSYKRGHIGGSTSSDSEQCVICRHEYEEDEMLLTLPCKHKYHSECIQQWLQINKICPVCSAGVTAS